MRRIMWPGRLRVQELTQALLGRVNTRLAVCGVPLYGHARSGVGRDTGRCAPARRPPSPLGIAQDAHAASGVWRALIRARAE